MRLAASSAFRATKTSFWALTWLWVLASVLPLGPFTLPLFRGSLSDTPRAYLVWIPVLAFCWAGWNLRRNPPLRASRSLSFACGIAISVGVVLLLVFGVRYWPSLVLGQDMALLLWPVWSAALLLSLFHPRTLKTMIGPLLYLFLVWPPIYLSILAIVNPFLEHVSISVVQSIAHLTNWMHPDARWGAFDVQTGGHVVRVFITKACSGSDSVLALLILFPIMLVLFNVSVRRRILVVLAGCLLTFVGNLLRITVIIFALHQFGYFVAFKILHPVLGAVLFFALAAVLLVYGSRNARAVAIKKEIGPDSAPSIGRRISVGFIAGVLAVIACPLYGWSSGSVLKPLPLPSDHLLEVLPSIPGYQQRADQFGASAPALPDDVKVGQEMANVTYQGGDNPSVTVHLRWTNPASVLNALDGNSLQIQNGERVLYQHPIQIRNGIGGVTYWVAVPSASATDGFALYIHTVFTYCAVYHYHRDYVRVHLSARITPQLSSDLARDIQNTPADVLPRDLIQSAPIAPLRSAISQYTEFRRAFAAGLLQPMRQDDSQAL